MSNIYIQEPPTSGKVLLKTSVGDLEIELWTKEAPKACRNFIQLCMEGYYNGTIFHRVVKGFICQGGDPTGTGQGGESIYGQPFKDEIHTRLRFCRRGLLAMANAGKDDNSSQFFFTFSATPELQNKHTIFGKVAGETIYNMLKLEDAIVDANERPTYPQKIIKTEILLNPFVDIVPRFDPSIKNKLDDDDDNDKKKKNKKVGVKNFKLLSFGEEAEEDEEESVELSKKYIGKGKSAHDSLSDPKLSSVLAIEVSGDLSCKKRKRDEIQQDKHSNDDDNDDDDKEECVKKASSKEMKERIISKLQDKKTYLKSDLKKSKSDFVVNDNEKKEQEKDKKDNEEEEEEEYYFGKDRDDENKKKVEAIQKEIRDFKKELKNEKFAKEEIERKKIQDIEKSNKKSDIKNKYIKTKEEFLKAKSKIPEKGVSREKATQELLMKFRNKLKSVKQQNNNDNNDDEDKNNKNDDDDDYVSGASWMASVLHCEEKKQPVLAKDASTKDDDWFEIYDPRNPINKRRRGDNTTNSLNNKSKKSNNSAKETTTRRGGTRY